MASASGTCTRRRTRSRAVWEIRVTTTSKRSGVDARRAGPRRPRRRGSRRAVTSRHMLKPSSSRRRAHERRRARSRPGCSTCWPRLQVTGTPCTSSGSAAPSSARRVVDGGGVVGHVSARPMDDGLGRGLAVELLDVEAEARRRRAAGELAVADLLVQRVDGVEQRLGAGRAPGRVHVDRHDLIDALHERVVVEHAAAARAHAHADDPLGLHHLVVDLAQHRRHLLAHPAGHDHEVGLAGRGAERLHAEAGDVVVGAAGAHHLDGAARQPEGGRHHRHAAGPLHEVLELAGEEVVVEPLEALARRPTPSGRLLVGSGVARGRRGPPA